MRAKVTESVIADADAIPRRGLAGDRDVRILDDQLALEFDGAADAEDDGARAICFDGFAERAGAAVFEGRHFVDFSATPTERESPVTFGPAKGQMSRAELPDFTFDQLPVGGADIDPPVIHVQIAQVLGREFRGGELAFELRRS